MGRALERHRERSAQVIPIILRPVDLQSTPLGPMQALPTNATPIAKWPDRDDAFLDVTNGIRDIVDNLLSSAIGMTDPSVTSRQQPARSRQLSDLTSREKAQVAFFDEAIARPEMFANPGYEKILKNDYLKAKIAYLKEIYCWDAVLALYDEAIARPEMFANPGYEKILKNDYFQEKLAFLKEIPL
jgi:hypothetical protein